MSGLEAVTDLAVYLAKGQTVKVFKHEKKTGFTGEYIVVNSLPFAFGKVVNDVNVLNVNIHVPDLSSGEVASKRLGEIYNTITTLIPTQNDNEDSGFLLLNGVYYAISSDSNPIRDTDGTHFINLIVDINFNDLNIK